MSEYHTSVLLDESVSALVEDPCGVYADATFGGGGHTAEILSRLSQNGSVLAFDRDMDAIGNRIDDSRLTLIHSDFRWIHNHVLHQGHKEGIDGILAEDEVDFANEAYRKVYEAYFAMYDEGLSQEQIQQRLLNNMDQEVSAVAREMLIEKYQITVKNYEQSLTATATRLVQFVPKTLMTYQCRRIEKELKKLTAELLVADEAAQLDILTKISEYNKARTRLNNELGRV